MRQDLLVESLRGEGLVGPEAVANNTSNEHQGHETQGPPGKLHTDGAGKLITEDENLHRLRVSVMWPSRT